MNGKISRVEDNPQVELYRCKRNKNFPNNKLPVLIYRKAIALPNQKNKAVKIIQEIFGRNGWTNCWQNGIYDFHHYHSNTHECMGIVKSYATVILGGPKGIKIKIEKGDVLILPAGVGHKCIKHTASFICVGAYPDGKDFDINYGKKAEFSIALKKIKSLRLPLKDPVFGKKGIWQRDWKN